MNEVMVTEELVAFVDENWRTIPGREGRTIAGFSMGGFGTAVYAARHPDLYCSAMIMALGGSDEYLTIWQENQTDIVASGLLIGLLVGEDDRSGFKGTNELHETLNQLEIGHTFTVVPGVVHNFGQLYNAAGLEALQFQTQCLAR
jgi:enterochelin esterase-like enzyme